MSAVGDCPVAQPTRYWRHLAEPVALAWTVYLAARAVDATGNNLVNSFGYAGFRPPGPLSGAAGDVYLLSHHFSGARVLASCCLLLCATWATGYLVGPAQPAELEARLLARCRVAAVAFLVVFAAFMAVYLFGARDLDFFKARWFFDHWLIAPQFEGREQPQIPPLIWAAMVAPGSWALYEAWRRRHAPGARTRLAVAAACLLTSPPLFAWSLRSYLGGLSIERLPQWPTQLLWSARLAAVFAAAASLWRDLRR